LGAALFGSALGGCAEQPSGGSAPLVASESSAASAAPSHAAPFDVASAIERARAAFYERDGLLVAGAETHRVELASGAFTFVPAHDTARETLAGLETLPTRSPSAEARRTTSSGSLIARSTRIEAETGLGAATAWVGRGSLRADGQLGEIRTVDGAVLMVRGSLVEELRNTREGLEQSWHFAAAPAGQEDLVVRVSTSGMTHVATTSTGEHFADSATGLGVRYGHGTFVDANGVRTAVPVAFEGGELVLRVPAEVIDEAAYPAVLDPTISAEITIDAPVTGPRGGNQVQPAIASNGVDTYLVVFTDGLFGEDDIRGARFGADGTLIDGNSFPIALATGTNQSNPAVTWNGTRWIVAWQDGRNTVDWDIYTTTVSSTGAVGAADGVALAATPGVNEQGPSLASAGAVTLAAYRSGDDVSSDVVGASPERDRRGHRRGSLRDRRRRRRADDRAGRRLGQRVPRELRRRRRRCRRHGERRAGPPRQRRRHGAARCGLDPHRGERVRRDRGLERRHDVPRSHGPGSTRASTRSSRARFRSPAPSWRPQASRSLPGPSTATTSSPASRGTAPSTSSSTSTRSTTPR
jgi:hypothetical protein